MEQRESLVALRLDLATARVLVWVASVSSDGKLTSEAHRYFFDRYSRLAYCHQRRGNEARARRLRAKADYHLRHIDDDGPPPRAAAAVSARPTRWLVTEAVSSRPCGSDDAA